MLDVFVFGVSKRPGGGHNRVINPMYDVEVCRCKSEATGEFYKTICKLMARNFPGEMYYAWDPEKAQAIYSFLVSEEETVA